MKILLTGANGFIGRYLLAALLDAGYSVVAAVRRPAELTSIYPDLATIAVDFNHDVHPDDWIPRLTGVDAVINAVGILQASQSQSIQAIHTDAPKALFTACLMVGIRRVIQLSAISARSDANTPYAQSKQAADEFLRGLDLDWLIIRPSLIYAPGAYGGTALFRALAALPGFIPLVGQGEQLFQPIYIDDLIDTFLLLLEKPNIRQQVIDPVGPEVLTLRQILLDLRQWLGLTKAPTLAMPLAMIRIAAKMGDWFGGPINTTALRQMNFGNTGPVTPFTAVTGIQPKSWQAVLRAHPAQAQDHWHARLYFLRPALRYSLVFLWLVSGGIGLWQMETLYGPLQEALKLSDSRLHQALVKVLLQGSCWLALAIGLGLLAHRNPRRISILGGIQIGVVTLYTLVVGMLWPQLWVDPWGPLLKNIPILLLVLVWMVLEEER